MTGARLEVPPELRDRAVLVDDLRFLAEQGEGLEAASHRVGISADTIDKLLRRRGEVALLRQLLGRDPEGAR